MPSSKVQEQVYHLIRLILPLENARGLYEYTYMQQRYARINIIQI